MKMHALLKRLFAVAALLAGCLPALAADYYVSTDGDDANAGTSSTTAFATLAHAVEVAMDGDTIHMSSGIYEITSAISLTEAIAIVGETGNPEDVVVRNTNKPDDYNLYRVFEINNAGAVLSGIAVEGGGAYKKGYTAQAYVGGNIYIQSEGGMVTNCIVRNGYLAGGNQTCGAGIRCESDAGIITHCVITNNHYVFGASTTDIANPGVWGNGCGGAAGVSLKYGKLLHSFIAENTSERHRYGAAVLLGFYNGSSALIENCTIANNSVVGDGAMGAVRYIAYQYANSATTTSPVVRNTFMTGSPSLIGEGFITDYYQSTRFKNIRFENCATDIAFPTEADFPTSGFVATSGFRVADDFRPAGNSSLVDAGAEMLVEASLDLAGNARVYNDVVDIGCYEYVGGEVALPVSEPVFSPESDAKFSPTLDVTLMCETEGASVYYTTDGSEPSAENGTLYNSAITLDRTTTIKAIAVKDGMEASGVVSATYIYKVVLPVYYVSPTGSDTTGDGSKNAPFATIAHAVNEAEEGKEVRVGEGLYEITEAIPLKKAIAVIGDADDPAKVVVRNTNQGQYVTSRVFEINHAHAVLAGVAVEGGSLNGAADVKGGNIWIDTAGGMVTNCIVRNARINNGPSEKTGLGGAGIWCDSANGIITHCVITNKYGTRNGAFNADGVSTTTVDRWGSCAAAVFLQSGKLLQSFIAHNTAEKDFAASIVYLGGGAVMENCSVVENRAEGSFGDFYPVLFQGSASPTIRNTLIYGNTGISGSKELFPARWQTQYAANLTAAYGRFVNCATDATIPEGLAMITEGIAFERDGFCPSYNSSLRDAGAEMTCPVAVDLAGNPRLYKEGKPVDIGCYECQARAGFKIVVR